MAFFKGLALFIGWITGSFAGIGVILCACGYLVTRAQLRTLGLLGLFEHGPDYYLQKGANLVLNLFMITVEITFEPMLHGLPYIGIFLTILLILFLPLAVYSLKKREPILQFARIVRGAAVKSIASRPWFWRSAILLALFFLLIFHLLPYSADFTQALTVRDLLYVRDLDEQTPTAHWILTGQQARLDQHFHRLLWAAIQTALVLALAWQVTSASPLRVWITSPFIVLSVMYTLFLPLAYGTIMRPTEYPVVSLSLLEDNGTMDAKETLFLLNRTEREFVLWDAQTRSVLWIPDKEVKAMEVTRVQDLFGPRGVEARSTQGDTL